MKIFKEIQVGGLSKEQLISQLTSNAVQLNKYADILFARPNFIPDEEIYITRLIKMSLSDLKLTMPSTFQTIVSRAEDMGMKICPPHLAAYLRLKYLDQPEGPYLTIASNKLENDENYPRGLYLRNLQNTLWLRGYRASDDWEFALDMEFIFQKA